MSEPTDQDRETAAEILKGDVGYHVVRDAIAAALAAGREKARAPFLALADEWDAEAARRYDNKRAADETTTDENEAAADLLHTAADAIRRAAEGSS